MKNWIKKLFCTHKYLEDPISPYDVLGYAEWHCIKCNKHIVKPYNWIPFNRD